jgi:hypothetical protein
MPPHIDEFWRILAAADGSADSVTRALARLPIPRIARFHRTLVEQCDRAFRWELWQAADIVFDPWGASDDGFLYFRLWLIGQGHGTYARALLRPDSLADNLTIQRFAAGERGNETFPHLEELLYSGQAAYDLVLEKLARRDDDRERPLDLDRRPRAVPTASRPKQAARYPRLAQLFRT